MGLCLTTCSTGIFIYRRVLRKISIANKKVKVAALSVISNSLLIILKVIAGILSGSVSIISEAIHSGMDLLASIIAMYSVRFSSTPADRQHPYGHGKMENISGLVEGILILIAAFLILKEALEKIINPSPINETSIAIFVMIFSGLTNIVVSRKLYKTAKEEDSMALEADALHLKTDVYTSFGVALGLILIKITGLMILDPIVAILVALLIIKEAWQLCCTAFRPLLDEKLPDEEEKILLDIITRHKENIISFDNLRTRKTGHIKHVDFCIIVHRDLTVEKCHYISQNIKQDIEAEIKNCLVHIYLLPDNS